MEALFWKKLINIHILDMKHLLLLEWMEVIYLLFERNIKLWATNIRKKKLFNKI